MGLELSPEGQKRVDEAVAREVGAIDAKSRREILASIHATVYDPNAGDGTKVARVQARFATLLVALSEQADRVQRWMVALTVAIAIMTLVLVALTVVMLCKT